MDSPAKKAQGHLGRNAVFTAIFTFLAFAIAQFGLMTVVKKGYAYLGYAAFITLFVPFVVHAIATKRKRDLKNKKLNRKSPVDPYGRIIRGFCQSSQKYYKYFIKYSR